MSNYGKLVLPLGMNAIQSSRSLFPWGCWITCCFNCCLEWLLPTMLRVRGLLSCRCFCSIKAHSFLDLPFPWSLHCHGSCWACGCCWHWNFIAWVWPQGPRIVCCYYWDYLFLPSFILQPSNFLSLPPFAVIWMKASHQGNLANVVLRLVDALQNRKGHRRVNMKPRVKYQHSQLAVA